MTGADTDPITKQNASLFLKVVNFDRSFLGRIGEPAHDALLHLRHQNAVAEMLPTFLGIVNRYNRPSACGRPSRVEDLPFGRVFLFGCTAAIDASYCSFVPPGKKWIIA